MTAELSFLSVQKYWIKNNEKLISRSMINAGHFTLNKLDK